MAPQTWLITGASSGFGAAIAEIALQAGHTVFATARNPSKAAQDYPRIAELGGHWIELDVNRTDTKQKVEAAIHSAGGKIDVVINNAGYSILGSIEDMSEEEITDQFNTNVFGPVRVIKGAVPFMRAQRAGTIVNISSIAGFDGKPTCAMYAGSKFALEGLSESLALELEPFNIRVLVVEPGAFRTRFLSSFKVPAAGMTQDYKGTVLDKTLDLFTSRDGVQEGDPLKGAQRIVDAIAGTGMSAGKTHLLRLPLGKDCVERLQAKLNTVQKNLNETKDIAHSTDY